MNDVYVAALRRRREELQRADDAISYVRRVAQGRADVVRDAIARTLGTTDLTPLYVGRPEDLQRELTEILADRLLAGGDRPPRPADEFSDDPLSGELDQLCAAGGFTRLDELDVPALEALAEQIEAFERTVSKRRRELFVELDAVTDELVESLRAVHGADGDADEPHGADER